VLAWLLIWQLASILVDNTILLVGPWEVALTLAADVQRLAFWEAVAHSALRIGVGFLSAFILGVGIASLARSAPALASFLDPAIHFIKSVPIVCFIVLLLVWFGSAQTSAIAVFLVVFPAIYFACLEGLNDPDRHREEMLAVFRVPVPRKVLVFFWPTMLPFLLAASRVAVGMSWKSGIAAELIGLPLGSMGERIYQAKIGLSSADILAWTVAIVLISLMCEKLFLLILRRSGPALWRLALPMPFASAPFVRAGCAQPPASVVLSGVSKEFDGRRVLQDLSFEFKSAGRYALNGPSGSGKTTLLSLLAGIDRPECGTIDNPNAVAMVFQETRLFEEYSAVENLQMISGRFCERKDIAELLGRVLPTESLDVPVSELSGGMRRRVELCRALIHPSGLLLLDEPFAGLDAANRAAARRIVYERLDGRSLVLASHDDEDRKELGLEVIDLSNSTLHSGEPSG
jgi:NitT/TauT family transport system permease protein